MNRPKKAEPKPKTDAPMFTCERCGKILQPYIGANGKTVSLRAHAEGSKKKFGKVLCLECINESADR